MHPNKIPESDFNLPPRYQFIKTLGKGAFGVVARYRDTLRDEEVAIKRVPLYTNYRTVNADEACTEARKILRELRILHNYRHPNLIGIKHAIVQREANVFYIYMVSRLMDADLDQVIHRSELTDDHVKYIMYQIFRGLHFLHRGNVIHRDIKPNNILATEECEVVLCDLGYAREVEPNENIMTEYVVTRLYRAPEIVLCPRHYTEQADIWAVGCTFYQLMRPRDLLFRASNYKELIVQIIKMLGNPTADDMAFIENQVARDFVNSQPQMPPGLLRSRLRDYPNPEAVDLLERCLAFNPNRRYSAEKCLTHPYFKDYFEPDHIRFESPQVDFSFETAKLNQRQLIEMIIEEIRAINAFAGENIPTPDINQMALPSR